MQQAGNGVSCHKTSPLPQDFTRLCCAWAEFLHAWALTQEGLAGQEKMPRPKINMQSVLEVGEDLN